MIHDLPHHASLLGRRLIAQVSIKNLNLYDNGETNSSDDTEIATHEHSAALIQFFSRLSRDINSVRPFSPLSSSIKLREVKNVSSKTKICLQLFRKLLHCMSSIAKLQNKSVLKVEPPTWQRQCISRHL